jgi:hypothetical protein
VVENASASPATLHFCAEDGNLALMNALIQSCRRFDVDAVDDQGFTAVMLAAMEGHLQSVNVLHEFGANLDLFAKMTMDYSVQGCNALHLAAFNDYPEVCHFLISQGMDPEKKTLDGRCSAMSHYGLCLKDNWLDEEQDDDPDTRHRLSEEEMQERLHGLQEARLNYVRNANWARRFPLMQTLIRGGLRWTAADRADHAKMQSTMDTAAQLAPVQRGTRVQNWAYLNAQIFRDCPGLLELIVSFV